MQPDNSLPPTPVQPPQPAAQPSAAPPIEQPASYQQPQQSTSPQPMTPPPEVSYQPPATVSSPLPEASMTPSSQYGEPIQDEVDDSQMVPGDIPREGDEELVRWQAKEYLEHERNTWWYVGLAVVTVSLMVLGWFLMQSISFMVLVPVMAAALVVYVRRPPVILDYTLSRKGIHVNDKLYDFEQFKEFGLVQDDREHAVLLVPRKRFQPGLTVYFPEDAGEALVDMLASRLPMREVHLDFVDRLTRFLRI